MEPNSKLAHQFKGLMVILFFFILWAPILQMIHPILPELESTENRKLAEKPKVPFSLKTLKNYTKQADRYLNDHYGFRNWVIRLNGIFHFKLLQTSPKKDVVLGRDGWLYYDSSADGVSLLDFCGYVPFRKPELEGIVEKITKINKFCKERGILFKLAVAPNKHTIYPEYLPSGIRNRQGASTRLDQLKDVLARNGLGSVLIDFRPALAFSKGTKPYPLYCLTDTHWNPMGSFIAYTEIMKGLLLRFPRINILDINKYTVIQKENRGLGDLSTLISISGLLKDMEIILETHVPHLAKKIQPPAELEGTHSVERYHIEKSDYPKLVMFLDSFGGLLVPYLSESFSDSLYIWYTPSNVNLSIIEEEKPQVVILELVERHLQYLSTPPLSTFQKPRGKS